MDAIEQFKQAARQGRIDVDRLIDVVASLQRQGVPHAECRLSHTRPFWRLENGRALVVAYEIYRGPKNPYGQIPGVLGRGEFGLEVVVEIAYMVDIVGLSFDKVCMLLQFLQNLNVKKSQADSLLRRLSRHWQGEFDVLCTLLANSMVVHADETSWSINRVAQACLYA
jgi:transposase